MPNIEEIDRDVVRVKVDGSKQRYDIMASKRDAPRLSNIADIEALPPGIRGIIYECFEDAHNDFAVIHSAFETISMYPDLAEELLGDIREQQNNIVERLGEIEEGVKSGVTYLLGVDLAMLKEILLNPIPIDQLGNSQFIRDLAQKNGGTLEFIFNTAAARERASAADGAEFLVVVLKDLKESASHDKNYVFQDDFEKHVYQKYLALMRAVLCTLCGENAVYRGDGLSPEVKQAVRSALERLENET